MSGLLEGKKDEKLLGNMKEPDKNIEDIGWSIETSISWYSSRVLSKISRLQHLYECCNKTIYSHETRSYKGYTKHLYNHSIYRMLLVVTVVESQRSI